MKNVNVNARNNMLNIIIKLLNMKISRVVIHSVFIIVSLFLLNGCSMKGVRHLTIFDDNGDHIKKILVVPLYSNSFGIGFGPDGKGLHTKYKLIIKKPFIFNSGDDFMSNIVGFRGIYLSPFLFIGRSSNVYHLLFIKKGFAPKLVSRVDIYNDAPIVMTKSTGNDNTVLIDMLLTSKYDQIILKQQFGIEEDKIEIAIVFDEKDIKLLQSEM
jgi:hypothetical protein